MQSQINYTGHSESTALNQSIDNVQRHSTEHEHELDRLGNTSQESCQSSRNEHGLVEVTLVSIYTTIHSISKTHQQTSCTNHLTNLEAGRSNSCQQLIVRSGIASLNEVNQVVNPSQPQWILTIYGSTSTQASLYHIGATQSSVVYRNSNHMMQTEWQQQTLQSTIDKWCQQRSSISGVSNPYTEAVDSTLNYRPNQSHNDGNNSGISNYYHWYETLTIEECQYIRQLAEVVVLVISSCTNETGDNTDEHTHVQSRCTQYANKVILYQQFLTKEGIYHSVRIAQHIASNTEDVAGNAVNKTESNNSCKSTAGSFLGPGTTNGNREENVQITNQGPAHIL